MITEKSLLIVIFLAVLVLIGMWLWERKSLSDRASQTRVAMLQDPSRFYGAQLIDLKAKKAIFRVPPELADVADDLLKRRLLYALDSKAWTPENTRLRRFGHQVILERAED